MNDMQQLRKWIEEEIAHFRRRLSKSCGPSERLEYKVRILTLQGVIEEMAVMATPEPES